MAPRILVLSARFGSGHLQAARAIAMACREQEAGCRSEVVDVENGVLRLVSTGYLTMLSAAPSAFRNLYQAPVGGGTLRLIRSVLGSTVRREVVRMGPTAVIATHPFPGAVAGHLRRTGALRAPVAVAVTDFIPHPLWVHEGIDRYFVASGKAALRLKILGVAPDRISVTGIPIRSDFAIALPFRLADSRRRVLVVGGGLGLGPIVEAIRSLAQLPHADLRVTVVCGTNEDLRRDLLDLVGTDPRFAILGYTDRVPDLMSMADLLVGKPGALTCSEALASGVPMLLLKPLPGQEEDNATYLKGIGAALVVDEIWTGQVAAELLFTARERLTRMQELARLAGRPRSAAAIAQEIVWATADLAEEGLA